jgi:hypothetical protein
MNSNPDVFFLGDDSGHGEGPLNTRATPDRYDRLSGRWFFIIDVPCTDVQCIGTAPNRWPWRCPTAAPGRSPITVWTFFFVQQDKVGGANTGEFRLPVP